MANKPPEEQKSLFPEPKKGKGKDPMLYVVKANARSSKCRGKSCGKTIYWVFIEATGRSVIVDCAPEYAPTHKLSGEPHPSAERCFPPVHPQAPGEFYGFGRDGQGIDHHATCADVAQFGRKTGRKNG